MLDHYLQGHIVLEAMELVGSVKETELLVEISGYGCLCLVPHRE